MLLLEAFNLVLHREGATLARRWSGFGGLHRRGYRAGVKMHKVISTTTTTTATTTTTTTTSKKKKKKKKNYKP